VPGKASRRSPGFSPEPPVYIGDRYDRVPDDGVDLNRSPPGDAVSIVSMLSKSFLDMDPALLQVLHPLHVFLALLRFAITERRCGVQLFIGDANEPPRRAHLLAFVAGDVDNPPASSS